jgi:hypothetical protein
MTTRDEWEDIAQKIRDLAEIAGQKTAKKRKVMDRLIYILGDDAELAQRTYNYVFLGHLSHANELRHKFADKGPTP